MLELVLSKMTEWQPFWISITLHNVLRMLIDICYYSISVLHQLYAPYSITQYEDAT